MIRRHSKPLIGQALTRESHAGSNKHTKCGILHLNQAKRSTPSKDMGLPAWQSVCSQFHPRVKIDHPMIRRFKGTRSKAKKSVPQKGRPKLGAPPPPRPPHPS
ncbi:hypothetical protein Tco_0317704 [Tanacetum coccineum]